MYPESKFDGEIVVNRVVKCERDAIPGKNSTALFWRSGFNLYYVYSHKRTSRSYCYLGSDVKYSNEEGWNIYLINFKILRKNLNCLYCALEVVFAILMMKEYSLEVFSKQLKSGWWYGIKHGLALLTHVAPLAYLYQYEKVYIASSNWPEIMPDRCASDPSIDNNVSYANCSVFHDGFPKIVRQK